MTGSSKFSLLIQPGLEDPLQPGYRSMRFDPLVWKEWEKLTEKEIKSLSELIPGGSLNPGNFALYLLDSDLVTQDYPNTKLQTPFLEDCMNEYQLFLQHSQPPTDLRHAAKMAIVLLEKRKISPDWGVVVSEPYSRAKNGEEGTFQIKWKSIFGVLVNLAQDREELVASICAGTKNQKCEKLLIPVLMMDSQTDLERIDISARVLKSITADEQLNVLREFIQIGESTLTSKLASRLVENYNGIDTSQKTAEDYWESPDGNLPDSHLYQTIAMIAQIAGDMQFADRLLTKADEILKAALLGVQMQKLSINKDTDFGEVTLLDLATSNETSIENELGFYRDSHLKTSSLNVSSPVYTLKQSKEMAAAGNGEVALTSLRQEYLKSPDQFIRGISEGKPKFNAMWQPAESVRELLELGAADQAEELLLRLLKQNPNNQDAVTTAIQHYKTQQNWTSLIPLLEGRVHFGQPSNDEIKSLVASYTNIDEHQKSFEISELLVSDPEATFEEKNNHAIIALKIGQLGIARKTVDDLLAINPEDPKALCTSGKIFIQEGDQESAKSVLRMAIDKEAEVADPWITLSDIYRLQADDQAAISILQNGMVALPKTREIKVKLAKTLFETGSTAEALPLLKQIRNEFSDVDSNLLLLKALKELHLEGLEDLINDLYQEFPGNHDIAFEYAEQCQRRGDYQTSTSIIKSLLDEKQANPEWVFSYADATIGLDPKWSQKSIKSPEVELNAILKNLNATPEVSPNSVKGELLRAEILQQKGLIEEAHEIYSRLLESNSGDDKSWFRRIQTWFAWTAGMLGKFDVALAAIRDVVNAEPEWIGARQVMAEITAMTDDVQSAVEQAEGILELAPEILDNQLWAGDFLARLGEEEKAEKILQESTQLQPVDIRFGLALSKLFNHQGKTEECKELLGGLAKQVVTIENDVLLFETAKILEESGDINSVEDILTQRLAANDSIENMLNLAGFYYQHGQFDESLNLLESVAETPKYAFYLDYLKADTLFRLAKFSQSLQIISLVDEIANTNNPISPTGFTPPEWILIGTSNSPAIELKMRINFEVGDVEKALELAQEASRIDPGSGLVNLVGLESSLALGTNRWMDGLLNLALIDRADPYYGFLAAIKMDDCLEKGKIDEAWEIFNDLDNPTHLSSLIRVIEARLLVLEGNTVEAEEIFDSAINDELLRKNRPLFEQASTYRLIINTALRLSRWNEALRLAQDISKRMPWHQTLTSQYLTTLVKSLEFAELGKTIYLSAHSPTKTLTSMDINEEFEWLRQNVIDGELANRWLLRGNLAIQPNQENITAFAHLKPTSNDAAAVMAALNRVGQVSTALQLSKKFPGEPVVLLQSAICESSKDLTSAVSILDTLISGQATDAVAIRLRAEFHIKASHPEVAVQDMETALKLWPSELNWHKTAAELWTKLGNEANAVVHWQAAVQNSPEDITTSLSLGKGLTSIGKAEEAIDLLKKLTSNDPNQCELWEALTDAYLSTGKTKEALATAERASEVNPFSVKPYLLRAKSYLEEGNLDEALHQVEKADQQVKNNAEVKIFMARVLFQKGDKAGALAALEDATRIEAVSPKTMLEEIKLIREINGKASARNLIEYFSQQMPENVELLSMLAESQLENSDARAAELTARRALKIAPDSVDMLMFLGKQQVGKGQLDQAIHSFSQVIKIHKDFTEAYFLLGEVYEKQREYIKAIEIIKQVIDLKPENTQGYLVLSSLYKNAKNYRLAEEMLKKAADIDPKNVSIKRQLGALLALNLVHQSQEVSSHI